MIRFYVQNGAQEIEAVETESTDDFYYFRDSIHAALENGEFGSGFPTLMKRVEPDEWCADELETLQNELETIADAFKKLPPKPFDSHWASKAARSGAPYASLFEVYVDAEGSPLIERLIHLCEVARQQSRPIHLE